MKLSKIATLVVSLLIASALLQAGEDRTCAAGRFQFIATPEMPVFSKGEPATFRLVVTNKTERNVRIVPHLFPFDYMVEKHRKGWKPMGGMVPAARFRQNLPLGPRDESEYRTLKSGESYSASFVVDPELLGKNGKGQFRIRVRAYAKETSDQNLRDLGCAMFTEFVPFALK